MATTRSGPRLAATALALAAALGALGPARPARADLIADAERLVRLWSQPQGSGASAARPRVERLAPAFVEHGRPTIVRLPAAVAEGAQEGCVTAVVLMPRTADFTVETEVVPDDQASIEQLLRRLHGQSERKVRSVAGAARVERCGADRGSLRHLVLNVDSSRATAEVIVASSAAPLGPLDAVFPERMFGPMAPRGDPGRPVEPGPIAERVTRAERRARAEGAARVARVEQRAMPEGNGEFTLKLPEGCHRLEVMAEVPSVVPRRATDIDAEAREASSGRMLDRDRGDAPDARLLACLGETSLVEVPFLGASGPARVVLSDALWPIPPSVPAQYGPRARGGFAAALLRRHAPPPRAQPIAEAVGVAGDTMAPVAVEPGRCYFAAATLVRGEARALRLFIDIGDRALRDDAREDSAGVAFCAEEEEQATVRVAARGSSPWWALAVWPMD